MHVWDLCSHQQRAPCLPEGAECPGPWGAEGPGGAHGCCQCIRGRSLDWRGQLWVAPRPLLPRPPSPALPLPSPPPFFPLCQCPDCCKPLRREGLLVLAAWPGPAPAAVGGAGGPGPLGRDRPQAEAGLWRGVGDWSFPGGHQAPGAARDPSLTLLLLCGIPLSPSSTWACSHAPHSCAQEQAGGMPGEELALLRGKGEGWAGVSQGSRG